VPPRTGSVAPAGGAGRRSGRMNSSGLVDRCVVPSRHGVFSSRCTCPAALTSMRSSDSAGWVMWPHNRSGRLRSYASTRPSQVNSRRVALGSAPVRVAIEEPLFCPGRDPPDSPVPTVTRRHSMFAPRTEPSQTIDLIKATFG